MKKAAKLKISRLFYYKKKEAVFKSLDALKIRLRGACVCPYNKS